MPTEPKQFKLHKSQLQFRRSSALLRCFSGGIGSGKTTVGAFDMIARAKPGRLYAVVSPSYQMLLDSTFRTFLNVASDLDVLDRKSVKNSAPPSCKLKIGCEMLFRSADNPDSLRGPNLSGVWIDEGSLMDVAAFHVMLGRLREAGELGWLSVTTTPKGKSNWVFDVFASNRPDTNLIRCATRDNPFLAERFASMVAQQYTSQLARQELEGEFIDSEGGLFRRAWFGIVDAAPKIVSQCRAWDLASTPLNEKKASDPDFSVGALLGKDEAGTVYTLDIKRLRGSPETVEQAVRETAKLDGKAVAIWMEEEGGSSGKVVADHYARRVLNGHNFRTERSTGSKADRAQPFAAVSERGLVKLVAGHWNNAFLDEIELFPFGAHDDQVDAASLAFNKLASGLHLWVRWGGLIDMNAPADDLSEGPRAITMEDLAELAKKCPKPEDDPHWHPLYGRSAPLSIKTGEVG
jgi:predicted phage terminase large subunit-like protein